MSKERGFEKFKRINIDVQSSAPKTEIIKPKIRPTQQQLQDVKNLKKLFRGRALVTVCEEASCPNMIECFSKRIATFMIMGDKCTRRCAFCDVAHGKPDALDPNEPIQLAQTIQQMQLKYVVVTSVDRDDLLDGGAAHFTACIKEIREQTPNIKIEILVPDFKKRMQRALDALKQHPPDVFNHNLETIPRLYKTARLGSDYQHSLDLLKKFKEQHPSIPTKSGLMVGLGETLEELLQTLSDLRAHNVDMLTVGQYLSPSAHHLPVKKYYADSEFKTIEKHAYHLGFKSVASGALVRSSYHADKQAENL